MFRLIAAGLACLAIGALIIACDDEEAPPGLGSTGDVGVPCDSVCYEPWCKNTDQIKCASGFCIGPQEKTYCTDYCDLDIDCPAGFVCTDDCNHHAAVNPACVREDDYILLEDLGYCP